MCTESTEKLLMAAEDKLEAVVKELGMPDQFADYYPLWFVKNYRTDNGPDLCCSDVIVALQDHTESLQSGMAPEWG